MNIHNEKQISEEKKVILNRMTGFFKRLTFGLIRRFMELKGQSLRGVLKADNVT